MIIRSYRPEDCAEMAQLFYDTVHTVNARDYTKEQLAVWATGEIDSARWNSAFLAHDTLVAEKGGIIVGFGDMDETGYLDRLYVHKDHQRQRIATAICDALEKTAKAATFTTHASITARPFFESRGYTIVKEQQVERQGVFLTNYVMKKPAIQRDLIFGCPGRYQITNMEDTIMTFLDLAKARYSVRAYKDTPIEQEKLDAILEAGKVAPTACNNQPQKIYVVKSEDLRKKLASVCQCTFDAPVILVIGYDKTRDWKNKLMPGYQSGETDAAIVCTHMMLEAWEQGIGSCWVGWFNAAQVAEVLGLPENVQVSALLPMGYAADGVKPAPGHNTYRADEDMVTVL